MIIIDMETLKYYFQEVLKFALVGSTIVTAMLGKYLLAIILVLLLMAIQLEEIVEFLYSADELYEDLPGDEEKKE